MSGIEGVLRKYDVDYNDSRAGNQQVKCPFHDDSHASASVNLDKGLFNCYGCGIAGDAIALLMDQEGMNFVEAKRHAEELDDGTGRQVSRQSGRSDGLLPRKSGHRPGRKQWVSPWAGRRP